MNDPQLHRYALILLLCLGTQSLVLANPQQGDGRPSQEAREARLLMHLLKMEDAELTKLRGTIERIERMSPEERKAMRQRLGKLREMDPGKREKMRQHFQGIPDEQRRAMRRKWQQMSREERQAWRRKLRGMTPEERIQAMNEEGFLPGGKRKKGSQNNRDGEPQRGPGKGAPPPLK